MRLASMISTLALGAVFVVHIPMSLAGEFEQLKKDLSGKDFQRLLNGEQVYEEQKIKGSSWPKMNAYQMVDATPEEAAAIFFDYENQVKFVKHVLEIKASPSEDAKMADVSYLVELPIPLIPSKYKTQTYTVRDRLSSNAEEKSYLIQWSLVKADYLQFMDGYIRFEPVGERGTLMIYRNYGVSSLPGASLFVGRARAAFQENVQAFANEMKRAHIAQDQQLIQQKEKLDEAIRGPKDMARVLSSRRIQVSNVGSHSTAETSRIP
jgi:hypothetical protein